MKKKLTFIGLVIIALVLTSGTFAYTYTSGTVTLPATLADDAWTTYQVSANQPDWNSLLPNTGAATATLIPVGEGDATTIVAQIPDSGEHWDKVDDQPSDEAATYISTLSDNAWQGDLYQIGNLPTDAETIASVTVFARFASGGTWTARAINEIITNEETFSGDTVLNSTTDWVTISTLYDVNPATGVAWTVAEVNDLQAGVSLKGPTNARGAYCTQVYVQVDYEFTDISQGDAPQGFLYNIYPHAQYTGDLQVKLYLTNTADLIKAYQYLNLKIYVSDSIEAGYTPNYKILSLESGVVEFSIRGGAATQYLVSVTGGSYSLISNNPAEWGTGYTLTPEIYLEMAQR
jgi:hypothetical protein